MVEPALVEGSADERGAPEPKEGILGGLDEDYGAPRDIVVKKVVSADGTRIAYDKVGTGPPVVVVGGGLNDRVMFAPLAAIMSDRFTVYNYDRRGRGDSETGDPQRWTIQREIEDLAAVLAEVGEPSHVFANCTGGQVAILAAAEGVPMAKLSVYEPPYWSKPATEEQVALLRRLIDDDRREEAVTVFCRDVVGFLNDETIGEFKSHPAWQAFQTMVPSTYYDTLIGKDHVDVPIAQLRKISVPTLVMSGDETDPGTYDACVRIAQEVPGATLLTKEGYGHLFSQKAWAPALMDFLES